MCRVTLSRPIPVVALVGRYLTNKLIGHEPLPGRLNLCPRDHAILRGHRVLPALSLKSPDRSGDAAIPVPGARHPCIPHPSATNVPFSFRPDTSVRLACLSHAASVRSEPGSNSSLEVRIRVPRSIQKPGRQIRLRTLIRSARENESRQSLSRNRPHHLGPAQPSQTRRRRTSHPHDDKPVHLSKSMSPRNSAANLA